MSKDDAQRVVIGSSAFQTKLTGQGRRDAVARVIQATQNVHTLVSDLRESIKSKNDEWEQSCVDDLTNQPETNLASLREYNQRLPASQQMLLEQCIEQSEEINPQIVAAERVTVVPRFGKSGNEIYFQSPGPKRWVAQRNLARIAKARFVPATYQHGTRGVPDAIANERAAVMSGNGLVATLEIDGLCANLDRTALPALLGAGPEWIESAFMPPDEGIIVDEKSDNPAPKLREVLLKRDKLGLLRDDPGSPVQLLINHCLSRLEFIGSPTQQIVNYDNHFVVLASSNSDRIEAIQRLRNGLANLPGGPFKLRETRRCQLEEGFESLGHDLAIRNGKLVTYESNDAFEEDSSRFSELEDVVRQSVDAKPWDCSDDALDSLAALVAFRRGWAATYDQCDDNHDYYGPFDGPIDELCQALQCSLKQVEAHIRPNMGYLPNALILGD